MSSSSSSPSPSSSSLLDPIRAHYLKKSLVALQFRAEIDAVHDVAFLGPPFRPSSSSPPDLPLLHFVFRHFLLSFPFLAAAPPDFFPSKLQPFLDSLFARNLFDDPDEVDPTRFALLAKIERNLAVFLASALKIVEPESPIRLSQADLDALERALDARLARRVPRARLFHINIVSVRTVTDRGRVRSRIHEEFIISTALPHGRLVYVSRRYGDFKTLADELRKAHPDAAVPSPPPKDRTAVPDPSAEDPSLPHRRLSREKNRLTLRAYLHSLLASSPFSSSPVLRSFLLSGPTILSPQEQLDASRREEADRARDQGRKQFAREIGARVDQLRDAVRSVKGELVGKDGLSRVFSVIKLTPRVSQLPHNYQAVMEWARISLASTIFQTFVASDNSSETFASLKRIHGLMPYFLLKGALRISNPVAMIRTVLDIFLAQPFGGRSLLQRMFTSSLTEEVKSLNTYIEHVAAKIDSLILCEKVRSYVYAPRNLQDIYRARARLERTHLLKIILTAREEPLLSTSLAARVNRAWSNWSAWMAETKRNGKAKKNESDSEEGPTDEDAWLFEDLRVLLGLYSRLRDREQLIALIFEGVTAELLKDIITIFYTPLAQVYRAASISESLGDLQNFINDLIRTVEETEDLSQSDPSSTVQAFIDLVTRHEQSFYTFVHKVHSKGQGLFDSLMKWIERFLTAIREGIGASALGEIDNKIALETLLPAGGEERAKIMQEIDQVIRWHYLNKISREEKLRSRFRRAQKGGEKDADAEDEATRVMIDSVARELDFGDLVSVSATELAEEESDEDEDSDDDDDDDDGGDTDDDGTTDDDANHVVTKNSETCSQPPLSRAETITIQTSGTVSRSQSSTAPQPVVPRPRTLSLRSTKSMNLLRKRTTADAPPVPPLPVFLNKTLPPHPPESSSAGLSKRRSNPNLASSSGQDRGSQVLPPSPPRRSSHKSRKGAPTQPPDLTYIPTLLPIFVEMMRPLLRPQS